MFGCLPSQLLAEDAGILRLVTLYGLGNDEEGGE
jgi:hypothetical protein